MAGDERTRKYVARRLADGRSTREIMRALKRYVARELYPHLVAGLTRSGVTGLARELPDTDRLSLERTAGPSLPTPSAPRGLIRARPHPSGPSLVCPHRRTTLDRHRRFALACRVSPSSSIQVR